METVFKHNKTSYTITRYPKTEDKTLKAWSNAEVYALNELGDLSEQHIAVYNDRFGFWDVCLKDKNVSTVWHYASQKKAIKQNLEQNQLEFKENRLFQMTDELPDNIDIALVKVPKSIDGFQYILEHIHKHSHKDTRVICCFMTKYFNKQILEKSQLYFEDVEQSLAWKKSRLVHLSRPKSPVDLMPLNILEYKDKIYKQYPGVFSASHIDYATQFLMEYLQVNSNEINVLDLASGNGVLGGFVQDQNPNAKLTFVDDFNLAIESSKLNVNTEYSTFLCMDTIEELESEAFDLVVSNPPFHFEHENNIDITLHLMKHVQRCLKSGGRFVFVANSHLNYKTHLIQWFTDVKEVAKNEKFVICTCTH